MGGGGVQCIVMGPGSCLANKGLVGITSTSQGISGFLLVKSASPRSCRVGLSTGLLPPLLTQLAAATFLGGGVCVQFLLHPPSPPDTPAPTLPGIPIDDDPSEAVSVDLSSVVAGGRLLRMRGRVRIVVFDQNLYDIFSAQPAEFTPPLRFLRYLSLPRWFAIVWWQAAAPGPPPPSSPPSPTFPMTRSSRYKRTPPCVDVSLTFPTAQPPPVSTSPGEGECLLIVLSFPLPSVSFPPPVSNPHRSPFPPQGGTDLYFALVRITQER